MRISTLLYACMVSLLLSGCESMDKCDGVACSTGPPSFYVLIIDKDTGENVFTSGRFKTADVTVRDSEGKEIYDQVKGEAEDTRILIALPSREGDISINLNLNASTSIPIDAYVYEGKSDCCTNYFP